MKRRGIFFLSILFGVGVFFCLLTRQSGWAEIYGNSPTGLLALEKKYPYYLYVPVEYSPDKGWPLAVVVGYTSHDPREVMDQWLDWAKKNQVFLLVTSIFPKEGYLPEEVDRWIIGIKQDVMQRYHILPPQVLLVGIESGAQYAAYLGMRYPNEFSAAALFRRAWPGPLEKLMRPSTDLRKQIPFYVAVDPLGESFPAVETKAAELERKGYPVTFDPLKANEDFSPHRDRLIQWFIRETETRMVRAKGKPHAGWKGRYLEMKKNVFGK